MAERTNPHANLIIGAQDEATPVFEKIKASSQSMAAGVEQAAAKAGQAVDGIGAGAEKSADKFTRAESLMRAAIMKSTRELELLGKTASQRFEAQIDFKGLEKAKFQEAISGLQAMESALSVAKAREAEFAAQNGFSLKAAQAKELVKASEYARWWAQELEKVEAAEKRLAGQNSFINSLKSQADAIGKTKADLLEMQAAQMGVATQAAPFIAKMREADAGLNAMGMSAKQTTAALRQVPMQFTDIVVSLQGGQSAMQVLLQQGGQLKDLFGGIGPAIRAMGGYVLGLVNPLTIAAAAVAGLGFAMYSLNGKDAALRDLSAQLIGTGRASAAAVGDIKALVNELNTVPGVSKAAATAIIGEFAKVSGLGATLFKDLGASVADFAAATGTDLPTAAKKLAEAFADPKKGAKALEDSLGTLTAAQILNITKMAEMGDKSGAQAALLDALKQATEGLAKQGMTPLGEATDKMSNAWDKLTTSVGNSSAFRTANDWLAKLIEKTAELTVRLSQMPPPTWLKFLPVVGPAIGAASLLAGPEANAGGSRSVSGMVGNMEGGATGSWGPTADDIEKQVKAALDLTRSYESQSAAMENLRGVAKVANDALKALEAQSRGNSVEAKELRERIAGVTEKLAEMAKKGGAAPKGGDPFAADREAAKQWSSYVEKFTKAAAEATAKTEGLTKSQAELVEYLQSPAYTNASEPMRETALQAAYAAIAQEQLNDATKQAAKVAADAAKSHAQFVLELSKRASAAEQQAEQLRMEEEAAAIAETGYYSLAQAIELVTVKRLEEQQKGMIGNEDAYLAVQKEIDARKKLVALIGSKEARKASEDAAKSAASEWQRAADDINRSLTDALLRGFESGKDFAKNLRDTVVNMFKTMVLRPIISAVVNPVAGALTGALGLSGAAQAATGGASALGMLSLGKNIYQAITGGFASLSGTVATSVQSGLNWLSGSGGMISQGPIQVGGLASGLGTVAGYGAGMLGGIYGGRLISGGYSAFGSSGNSAVNVGTIAGTLLGGPLGALVGGLLGGGVNRLFGRKLKDSGIEGDFGGATGFEGRQFEYYKGGVFRSDKTKYKDLGEETRAALADTFNTMRSGAKEMAGVLGLGTEAIDGFTAHVKVSLKGLSAEEADKRLKEEFDKIAESLASTTLGTEDYTRSGETAVQTLTRLSGSLTTVNSTFDTLGYTLYEASLAGGDMASQLVDLFGSRDAFNQATGAFFQNFYSVEDQRAAAQRGLQAQLDTLDMGLVLPDIDVSDARDQFRALAEAQDRSTEEGQKAWAMLMQLSGAFAGITEAAQTTTQTLEQQRQAYYGALQDAVSARNKNLQSQLSAAQDVASTLENLFGILRSNVRELYGEVDGTRGMLASQGNAFIDKALATAKASGYLPDADKLAEAIGAVRGGMDGRAYTTQFAADRDRLVLAGKLSGLEGIAEKQLTDAQKTVRALETQIEQNEQVLDYWKQQIEIASGTHDGILSVEAAVQQLSAALGGVGTTKPGTPTPGGYGGGGGVASSTPRVGYGAEEALTSFEKFKAWYQGLRNNADPTIFKADGYQVPDWLKLTGTARDGTNQELFGQYQFFKNNSQYAKDFEHLFTTGKTNYATDGSTLVKSDLSKMPAEVAAFFKSDRNSLLSYESLGLDPVLAYQLYQYGPEMFGLDQKKDNFTEWLRNNKWTEGGIVANNNAASFAGMGYAGYNLTRRDLSTGNIVGLDGVLYSNDGKPLGRASQAQLESAYGAGFVAMTGGGQSSLYRSQVGGGASEADYYGAIKTNLDQAIASGKSAQWIADAISSTGASMRDVATAYGISVSQLEENLRNGGATNIPKFDIGTNYVPRDMLAYIHEGEAVVPKAYNPAAGGGGAGGNAELVAEVRALREQNATMAARLEVIEKNTQLMPEMGRQFDQYSNGGTFSRQKVVA